MKKNKKERGIKMKKISIFMVMLACSVSNALTAAEIVKLEARRPNPVRAIAEKSSDLATFNKELESLQAKLATLKDKLAIAQADLATKKSNRSAKSSELNSLGASKSSLRDVAFKAQTDAMQTAVEVQRVTQILTDVKNSSYLGQTLHWLPTVAKATDAVNKAEASAKAAKDIFDTASKNVETAAQKESEAQAAFKEIENAYSEAAKAVSLVEQAIVDVESQITAKTKQISTTQNDLKNLKK